MSFAWTFAKAHLTAPWHDFKSAVMAALRNFIWKAIACDLLRLGELSSDENFSNKKFR